ncbi:hypothetical protein [Novosphingobium sp. P6W]|uniref:hypothetical protein n=1 Tax=Novosphingobium sp. P6W TaxID=1609758 RepID=UPI0005C62550|nr:hypothetical protein [Novosphingobium sp. P6W]AXB79687.1 hypothetical protein TQ38_024975 [Novosphingobium sp. P6W]
MSLSQTVAAGSLDLPAIQLTPQDRPSNRGRNAVFSILLSLAVIAAVVHETSSLELRRLPAMIPSSPAFWLVFAASYLITPASEWLIFRRLWGIPATGFLALVRKKVYNELLLGYLGEAYFYTWARRRVTLAAAPFGAVKDVAILSAMTGNVVTVVLLALVLPLLGTHALGIDARVLMLSLGVILVISIAAMAFRRRVFSLRKPELWMIGRMHLARIILSTLLSAILWHLVLPGVALSWWFYLATLRLLVSRLPLIPNKDLLFAGITVVVLGEERDIGTLMALMAGLILAAHLVLGALVALHDLVNLERRP